MQVHERAYIILPIALQWRKSAWLYIAAYSKYCSGNYPLHYVLTNREQCYYSQEILHMS